MKQAVIILHYKKYEDTLDCIASVKSAVNPPHIIVVDNASPNDSVKVLRDAYPDLDLIESKENLGFSGGNNLGVRKALDAGAEAIFLLNNDTVVDPNLFVEAAKVMDENTIVGAKIYYAKGYEYHEKDRGKGNVLWYAGGFMDWTSIIARHRGVDEEDQGQYDTTEETSFITGCFMGIPRAVFDRIGSLDDRFFLYLEDTDYSLRALRAGIRLLYHPKAILYHKVGQSTGSGSPLSDYYITRNRLVIGSRYGSLRTNLALFREALTRNWGSPVRRQAFLDFVTGKLGSRNEKILGK